MVKVKCPFCEDIIESIAPHDFKWCKCKKTFVDDMGRGIFRTTPSALVIK